MESTKTATPSRKRSSEQQEETNPLIDASRYTKRCRPASAIASPLAQVEFQDHGNDPQTDTGNNAKDEPKTPNRHGNYEPPSWLKLDRCNPHLAFFLPSFFG